MLRTVRIVGAVLVVVGLAGLVWSATQLSGGLGDVPGHWWSTLATAPLVVGATILGWAWWLGGRLRPDRP